MATPINQEARILDFVNRLVAKAPAHAHAPSVYACILCATCFTEPFQNFWHIYIRIANLK